MIQRKFKFRVWDGKSKTWIYGPNEEVSLFGETILLGGFLDGISLDNLNDCRALQFTGLKDKNNNEIYEGDILECPMPDFNNPLFASDANYKYDWWLRGIVKYHEEYARFVMEFYSPFGGEGYTGLEQHISHFINNKCNFGWWVIGNIYENPELDNK